MEIATMTRMNRMPKIVTVAAVVAVCVSAIHALQPWSKPDTNDAPPALPAQPAKSPITLLQAQPFTLEKAATHWFRKEQPTYTAGYVLVLAVDPSLVFPRQ